MPERVLSEYERDYNALMGGLVIRYNHMEGSIKSLLADIAHGPRKNTATAAIAVIMTVELGAVGVEHALKSIATSVVDDTYRDHVLHAVALTSRLRAYRNYYVHGVGHVIRTTEGLAGFVHINSAKGSLKEHKEVIMDAQLIELITRCDSATRYIESIRARYRFEAGESEDWPEDWPEPYIFDKPSLPDELSKPAILWTNYFPPPQSPG
jgi:hypothetical protein